MKMTSSACWAILMLSCIGSPHSGNTMKGNIFHSNDRQRINLGGQEGKQVQLISSRPAKLQLLGSKTRLVSSTHRIKLSDMKSALFLFAQKQRNLQITSDKKKNKINVHDVLISQTEKANKARNKIKKLQRRAACTGEKTSGNMIRADCNLDLETQTTTPKSRSGMGKNPNPQPGDVNGLPAVQAPPQAPTTSFNETNKTTRMVSLSPTNMLPTSNHPLTSQSKPLMTVLSAPTTAITQPYATSFISASKRLYPKTYTDTTQTEFTYPVTSTALSLTTIQGNKLINLTTQEMSSAKWYRYRASAMELTTSPSRSSQTSQYFTRAFQGTTHIKPSLVLTTSIMSERSSMSSALDKTASITAISRKDLTKSVVFITTLQTLSTRSSYARETITVVNSSANITATQLLTRSSEMSEARPSITKDNHNATIVLPLTTISVTRAAVVTPRMEKHSSGTNGGFFISPGGIAVIAVIIEVISVVIASFCIYCFVSGGPCLALKDKDNHKGTSDKDADSDHLPYTSMGTLSASISSSSSGSDVLMTPVVCGVPWIKQWVNGYACTLATSQNNKRHLQHYRY